MSAARFTTQNEEGMSEQACAPGFSERDSGYRQSVERYLRYQRQAREQFAAQSHTGGEKARAEIGHEPTEEFVRPEAEDHRAMSRRVQDRAMRERRARESRLADDARFHSQHRARGDFGLGARGDNGARFEAVDHPGECNAQRRDEIVAQGGAGAAARASVAWRRANRKPWLEFADRAFLRAEPSVVAQVAAFVLGDACFDCIREAGLRCDEAHARVG